MKGLIVCALFIVVFGIIFWEERLIDKTNEFDDCQIEHRIEKIYDSSFDHSRKLVNASYVFTKDGHTFSGDEFVSVPKSTGAEEIKKLVKIAMCKKRKEIESEKESEKINERLKDDINQLIKMKE